ncbi:MAG TPA: hypothetical protein VJW77_00810 [Terriglobia bacterium]|nr:hypothetical protein [Terriglobia bacterium]
MASLGQVFGKIGALLGSLAPTIATALGGPLAGSAVAALTKAIGLPEGSSPDAIEQTILKSTDPNIYMQIKKADEDYALQLQQIGIDAEKISEADRESARQRESVVKDKTPRNLAYLTVGFFWIYAAASIAIYIWGARILPEAVLTILVGFVQTILGYAISENKQVLNYYFGSSAGSAEKTKLLAAAGPVETGNPGQ